MRGELKERVASGVVWSVAEKVGTMLLQAVVSVVVLRLLMPEDYGVLAVLTAFSAFALVVVDSGFSQTLIRKASPTQGEFDAVFRFNVVSAGVLYLALTALAPRVAAYYAMPELARVAPVFFLLLPVNALCVIQQTIFTRQFRFALLSKVSFAASLASGFAAVAMALAGCGVWSLVAQRVLHMAVRALLLWRLSDWRPGRSSERRFAAWLRMAPFSLSLMASDLISALYNKIPQLVIGRIRSSETLGYFDQAQKLKDLPLVSAMTAVQGVIFPAFSKISDDGRKFAESYRQVLSVVAYVFWPVMLGLSAVSYDLFAQVLGEKWMPTAPYFEAACLAGIFYPVAMTAYCVMKARCTGTRIIRLELLKKAFMTVVFAVTLPRSVQAVVWGLVAIAGFEAAVNLWASVRATELSAGRLVRTLLPVAAVAAAMYGLVRLTGALLPADGWLRLVVEVGAGAAAYVSLSALFRIEAFGELRALVRRQFMRS